jgi:post-segregation antitoxin (ccd killing protein)
MNERPQIPRNARRATDPARSVELHKKWLEENAEAIRQYNERVDSEGLLNEGLRRF